MVYLHLLYLCEAQEKIVVEDNSHTCWSQFLFLLELKEEIEFVVAFCMHNVLKKSLGGLQTPNTHDWGIANWQVAKQIIQVRHPLALKYRQTQIGENHHHGVRPF